MSKEIQELEDPGTWQVVPRSKLPERANMEAIQMK
jgi:hypothetical protein